MSLVSKHLYDGEDYNGVEFSYTSDVISFEFNGQLSDESETRQDIRGFLDSAKKGKAACIEFEGSNGASSISFEKGKVEFHVSKYGGSGSGDMSVTLPLQVCISALEHAS